MEIFICKADPIGRDEEGSVQNVLINISSKIPKHETIEDCREFHRKEAGLLADALHESLPQGTRHELIIELMQREVNVFRGR